METTVKNETLHSLFQDLGLTDTSISSPLETLSALNFKYLKDLKINVGNVLNSQHLSRKEALFLAYATALNQKEAQLSKAFETLLRKEQASDEELAEVVACVSLLNVNNVYYRFRHYLKKDSYTTMPAGIKMSIMMNPVLGKEFFELVSLAVSALNGCELCVTSHEQSVLGHGGNESRIHDAIRIAAVIKGFCVVL